MEEQKCRGLYVDQGKHHENAGIQKKREMILTGFLINPEISSFLPLFMNEVFP